MLSNICFHLNYVPISYKHQTTLKQNYQADDDIAGMIESRLNKLNAEN